MAAFDSNLSELKRLFEEANTGFNFSETTFKRFLRGRKNVLGDALAALLSHAEWRRTENVDNITENDCSTILAKKVTMFSGRDKLGRPLITCLCGRHDKNNRDINEIKKFIIHYMELSLREANPEDEMFSIVFDLSAFSLRCMDFESVKLLVDILQQNYPEVLGQALVVNSPFIFSACWRIIKPWLDPVTAAKVNFVNLTQLQEFVDPEYILPEVGDSSLVPLDL